MKLNRTNEGGSAGLRGVNARHGMGIAAVIVMLSLLNVAVIGSVVSSGEELQVGAMRAESSRAFYAAESGAVVVLRLSAESMALPTAGSTVTVGQSTVTFSALPATGVAGNAVLIGRSGSAERRVRLTLDDPL